jgi:hypothetical protein
MKLSTQRKLTIGLGITTAVLMCFLLLQATLGIGTGYQFLPGTALDLPKELTEPLVVKREDLGPEANYLEVNTRFLFAKDRTPPSKVVATPAADAKAIPPVPLNMQLTGIVITRDKKIAMLRSTDGSQSFRLQEGRPLPGERAGWTLQTIENRKVIFDGGPNGLQELKLDVAASTGAAPAPIQPVVQAATQMPGALPSALQANQVPPNSDSKITAMAPPPPPNPDQAAREAEVQRIIEERRAQMRAEAERLNSGKE